MKKIGIQNLHEAVIPTAKQLANKRYRDNTADRSKLDYNPKNILIGDVEDHIDINITNKI